jgi:hypothetical protein
MSCEDEKMIISDLAYMNEVASEKISGGTSKYDFKFTKKIDVKVNIDIRSNVYAKGAQNELTFDLTAVGGYGSGTEIKTEQIAAYDKGYYVSSNVGTVLSYAR